MTGKGSWPTDAERLARPTPEQLARAEAKYAAMKLIPGYWEDRVVCWAWRGGYANYAPPPYEKVIEYETMPDGTRHACAVNGVPVFQEWRDSRWGR